MEFFCILLSPDGASAGTGNMKSGFKKGWKSIMPLCLRGKLTMHFCMFPKVPSAGSTPGNTPVYLNVYDLTPMNGYVYWAGLGIFHSGVEVHGVEYAFGAHDYRTSGVFEVEPRQCPGFKFRKSIFMGMTCLDPVQVREFMERHSVNYYGDTYHLIARNCNHFCDDICYKLTGNSIPKWVNRLARIGSVCNCILPEQLQVSAVRHEPDHPMYDNEKKRLRSAFCCLTSISMRQRNLSTLERMPAALGTEKVQQQFIEGKVKNAYPKQAFLDLKLVRVINHLLSHELKEKKKRNGGLAL